VTAPGGRVGTAYISFHAETGRLRPELEAALRAAGDDANGFLDDVGQQWGDTLSDSASTEIRKHGPDFAKSMEHALTGQIVSLGGVKYRVDRRGFLHDLDLGRFGGKIVDEVAQAFNSASRPGGPFSKIGEGIADAIGAGFNVSGRSPLIAVLPIVFGALAGAITAAVQAVNALLAVLVQVPSLLVAIGLQAGVLMIAFDGVGTAISGAFAAKNWNEFYAAIQGLTPAAKNFVVTLLPLRDLFRELKTSVQESFFSGFGNTMVNIVQELGPILRSGLPQLANALGNLFKQIGLFFASPVFVDFVNDIIPATIQWLGKFGPTLVSLMTAVFRMADAAIPALSRLGDIVNKIFGQFTSWLTEQIQSGNLTKWLEDMGDTLELVGDLFLNAAFFVTSFLDALNKNGGQDIIQQLSEFFYQLGVFFSTPQGQAAMAGFVHLVEALTYAFAGLVFTFMGALIAIEAVIQFFAFLGTGIQAFITWLIETAGPAIGTFFTETVPGFFGDLLVSAVETWDEIVANAQAAWDRIEEGVKERWDKIVDFFQSIPGRILGAVAEFGLLLYNAGKSLMDGLKEGLQWGWDHTVGPILNWITNQLPNWKGPLDKDKKLLMPAGKAAMEGFAAGLRDGAMEVKDMLGDFTNSIRFGGLSASNTFNTNLNFMGQPPTVSQAKAAGAAVSNQLNKQVASNDTRLAVRMA